MVTAVFQGTLNIPLYDTGIVVAQPGSGTQLCCGTGDQPFYNTDAYGVGDIYTRSNNFNYFSQLSYTQIVLFTLTGASELTIGPSAPPSSGQFFMNPGIMAENNYVNGAFLSVNVAVPGFPGYLPVPMATPFYQSKSTPSLNAQGADDNYEPEGLFGLRNAMNTGIWNDAVYGSNHSNRPNVSKACIVITENGIPVGLTSGLSFPFFNGSSAMSLQICANRLRVNGITPTTYMDNAAYFFGDDWWMIPAPEIGSNYLWSGAASSSQVYLQTVIPTCDIAQASFTTTFTSTRDALSFDNPVLNALLSTFATSNWMPCSTGNIFATNQSGQFLDYFVSKDGTKYWLLNYVQIGAKLQNTASYGATIPGAITDSANSRWIDSSGIFWYTGDAVSSGGETFVANSFGFDIPFSPIVLPYVPPISFPCWSACLGRVGGAPGQTNFASQNMSIGPEINTPVQNTGAIRH
jgi:hypothetical protein